jgi:hypothetical protein
VLCALVPDACGPLSSALKVLGLPRTAALTGSSTPGVTEVEPVDRTLSGLLPADQGAN